MDILISNVMHCILIAKKNTVIRPRIESSRSFVRSFCCDFGSKGDEAIQRWDSIGVGLKRCHLDGFVISTIV